MRWLGVDYGSVRVGIAICDPDERLSVTYEVVPASAAAPALRAIAQREEAGGFVVGLPLVTGGAEGAMAEAARRFGERLRRMTGLPVEYMDERYSTWEAEQRVGRHRPADDLAAALILQAFLDTRTAHVSTDAAIAPDGSAEDGAHA